jgi:hypothetical protein
VAHAYNPSYSGGRHQEDRGSKPAWGNSLRDSILKNPSQKRAGGMAQGVGPEFKSQYHKKKKRLNLHLKNCYKMLDIYTEYENILSISN